MEILAPAGDGEMLRAAVFSGADCVYLGVAGFNARRGAGNFEGEALRGAVSFCHARGCGVYAALNTLVLPGREAAFARAVLDAAEAGCDGLIVQDLGGAMLAKKLAPGLPLHASTQMSVHSPEGVRQLAELGFTRAILAREMTRDEIEETAKAAQEAGIELEVFVHGALCVSVSGQCMMSAFLGGRSGNQGACAGPCRLPFRACREAPGGHVPAEDSYHLSLKDLSILDALPQLAAMGIASAKIEGRLRGPEYCAVAVDSAQKALRGEGYDRQLLVDIFSREGFTDGWYSGKGLAPKGGEAMFGTRTGADSAASKAALPKARELYRRERPRVPVCMALREQDGGWTLTVSDGAHEVAGRISASNGGVAAASALREALAKTGGTPFYVQRVQDIPIEGDAPLPSPIAAKAARRAALETLLTLREAPQEGVQPAVAPSDISALLPHGVWCPTPAGPALRAAFAHVAQMPPSTPVMCEELLFPLFEADEVPAELRAKTRLVLPRVLFGKREEAARALIEKTCEMGFLGYEAGNIAHLSLCRGLPLAGGFGLNTANALTAGEYAQLGCKSLTLSPELSLAQMRELACALPEEGPHADALCYGHLPLMVTRACPLLGTGGCETCDGTGVLLDRKGEAFPVHCEGGLAQGVRIIYNTVPLWMGDELARLPTRTATLLFTLESQDEAARVLRAYAQGERAPGAFTRGLYNKGTAK